MLKFIDRLNRKFELVFQSREKCAAFLVFVFLSCLIATVGIFKSVVSETWQSMFVWMVLFFSTEILFVFYAEARRRILRRQPKNTNIENSIDKATLDTFSLFLAAMLQKRENRQAVLGDLEEQFRIDQQRFGTKKAYKLFWRDLIMSVYPAISSKISKLFKVTIWGYIIEKFISK